MNEPQHTQTDSDFLGVIEELHSISESAVSSSQDDLTIYRLPSEFLEIFLDIPGRRGGFCIISATKLVIFFDEDPNLITVIGKNRNKQSGTNTKTIQLLKVYFSIIDGDYKYKDNTGGQLNPNDIIDLLIKWIGS